MFYTAIPTDRLPILEWSFGNFGRVTINNVYSDNHYDQSIVAILKALLAPRLEDNRDFYYYYYNYLYIHGLGVTLTEDMTFEDVMGSLHLRQRGYGSPSISIVAVNEKSFEFLSARSRGHYFPAVEQYIAQKSLPIIPYHYTADNGSKHTVIIIKTGTARTYGKCWHTVASLIPVILPWFFENTPLADDERDVLQGLDVGSETFLNRFKQYLDRHDYAKEFAKAQLKGFTSRRYDTRLSALQRDINAWRRDIENYYSYIAENYRAIEQAQYEMVGVEEAKAKGENDDDLLNYIVDNKSISIKNVRDNIITFVVNTYITNYDPDIYDRVSRNHLSSLYARVPTNITKEKIQRLYDAIFVKEKFKLRVTSKVKLGLTAEGRVYLAGTEATAFDDTRLRNPHLYHHRCFGGNEREIVEAINAGDYIKAISQVISSVSNLNFADGYVMQEFSGEIFNEDCACIELPNGDCVTAREAIEVLNNEQTY